MNAIYHLRGNENGATGATITVPTQRPDYTLVTDDHIVREDGARKNHRYYVTLDVETTKTDLETLKKEGYTIQRGADIKIGGRIEI